MSPVLFKSLSLLFLPEHFSFFVEILLHAVFDQLVLIQVELPLLEFLGAAPPLLRVLFSERELCYAELQLYGELRCHVLVQHCRTGSDPINIMPLRIFASRALAEIQLQIAVHVPNRPIQILTCRIDIQLNIQRSRRVDAVFPGPVIPLAHLVHG